MFRPTCNNCKNGVKATKENCTSTQPGRYKICKIDNEIRWGFIEGCNGKYFEPRKKV